MINEKVKRIELYPYRPKDVPSFAVCLVPTPAFPDNGVPKGDDVHMYSVSAATDQFEDETNKWSWICLDSDEKKMIGEKMIEDGCLVDEWFWCVGYGDGNEK